MYTITSVTDARKKKEHKGFYVDLHSHTLYSNKPTNYLTKRIGIGECMTRPMDAYNRAKSQGMSIYTATDHDSISANLELISQGIDVPISVEVSARFPHANRKKRCKIHVLTYDIPKENCESIFTTIMDIRDNIYDLIAFYDKLNIPYMIAHPLYAVNELLTTDIFEQLLLLADHFELNGSKSLETNSLLDHIISSLNSEHLEMLADKYSKKIKHPKVNIAKKYANKAGQDAHILSYVARSFTYNSSAQHIRDLFFTFPEQNEACVRHSVPENLEYVLYRVGIEHKLKGKPAIEAMIASDPNLTKIYQMLTNHKPKSIEFSKKVFFYVDKHFLGSRMFENRFGKDDIRTLLTRSAQKLPINFFSGVNDDTVAEKFHEIVKEIVDHTVIDYFDAKRKTPVGTFFFNLFKTMGTILDLEKYITPYAISTRIFHETRRFGEQVKQTVLGENKPRSPRIGHFFDTIYEINGPAKFAISILSIRDKLDGLYRIATCSNDPSKYGEDVIRMIYGYQPIEYRNISVRFPSLIEVINYCYEYNFTHIHAATPGPLGLAALFAAKHVFNLPFFVTHHTELAQYIGEYTDDIKIEQTIWDYLNWFYSQADIIFALSCDSKQILAHHGIDESKIRIMKRGIDIDRFTPHGTQKKTDGFHIVTSCRMSTDKRLQDLIPVVKNIMKRTDISWTFIGDGPYKPLLQKELNGYHVNFTGFLHGADYVQALKNADLFVFPSIDDTFGQTPLEAMACGVPVIVTDRGGPKDNVVDGETGLIVRGKHPQDIINAITIMLDKSLLSTMGMKAREYMETRSFENAFHEFYTYYLK
ncbi:MAG: glycosyltransferase [Desulfobacterales bacterium]|nr:glycosyltransferase [Desulfobacterales bacterium]